MSNIQQYRVTGRACLLLATGISLFMGGCADQQTPTAVSDEQRVKVIRTPQEVFTIQQLPNFVGISGKTAGARWLSMNLVVIPPGGRAEPHYHAGYESAVFVLEGRVETRYGPGLQESVVTEAGDFMFIPPDVPHQPVNLSDTEAARAIVVRNDPDEQEHVMLYDPGKE